MRLSQVKTRRSGQTRRIHLTPLRVLVVALFLSCANGAVVAQDYNANFPQSNEDPGDHPSRELDSAVGQETIDPFTGALKLVVTDLVVPSNGGLDLKVVRTYQSFSAVTGVQVPIRSYQRGRTATGIGWDLHFGRLWRGPVGNNTAPQLQATNTANACNVPNNTNSRLNPVLELPDGHRESFAAADAGKPYAFISTNQWILKCLPTSLDDANHDGGAIVVSPEGIQYTFNFYHKVSTLEINPNGSQPQSNYAYHVTKIQHPNGTSISITYQPVTASSYASLNTVTHSEGAVVSFTYTNLNTTSAHLSSFQQTLSEGGTRIWNLNYIPAVVPSDSEYLQSVTRPDGRSTAYAYFSKTSSTAPNPDGVFSLSSVTTPLNGLIGYTYKQQTFAVRDGTGAQPNYVIDTKSVHRLASNGIVDGEWRYTYQPAPTGQTQDSTTVVGPVTCTVYTHWVNPSAANSKWEVGLLASKSIGNGSGGTTCSPLRTETYTWQPLYIAAQAYFRPPGIQDANTFAPRLGNISITEDGGSAYTKAFNNPDIYGNPAQIVESGYQPASFSSTTQVPVSRTTNLTYFTDTTSWIIHRSANETVVGAGTTYATPTSSPVTSDYAVVRQYFPSGTAKVGLLQLETAAGVPTHYDYYTDAVQGGAASSVTDANGFVTNFASYKAGIPRTVSRSIDGAKVKTITKTVGDSGMILSTDDGEGNTTHYSYDSLNRLATTLTARTDDSDLSITRSGSPSITSDTVTRGTYKEVRQYDGFGALTRTDWTDTSGAVSSIFRQTSYDAEGRVHVAYLPNNISTGDTYTYDYLGRITNVKHADTSSIIYQYQSNGIVKTTDERGFVTFQYYRGFGDPESKELMRVQAERGDSPGSGLYQVTYLARNLIGQVTSINQENVVRTYKYNSAFQLFEEDHPEVGAMSYGLDAMGHVTSRAVGSSGVTHYVLDRLYRLNLIQYPDSTQNVDLEYYNNDLLKTGSKAGTLWTYTYDANHNLQSETLNLSTPTYPVARTYGVSYGYDGMDGRKTVLYPTGLLINYSPDAFGRPSAANASVSGATITRFVANATYWPSGQLNTVLFPNGVSATYGQDNRLRVSSITSTVALNGGTQTLVNRTYGYDFSNDINAITDNYASASSKSMSYDGLRRLRTSNGGWGSGSVTYNSNDNIATKVFGGISETFNYDANNRLTSVTGSTPLTFGYDVYGNEISTGRSNYGNYTFDDESLLKTVKNVSAATQISYLYDANRHATMEQYPTAANNGATKFRVYGKSGLLLFEEDVANFYTVEYVYLGTRLVASRFLCTSTQDTDGDGMSDCQEARLGFNKNDPSDGRQDADGDGLTNAQEVGMGTDPFNADTDGDGLSDLYETSHGLNALLADSNSDPDGDGLTNLQEAQKGTNPLNADSDHDGIPDGVDPHPTFNPATFAAILKILLLN